MREKLLLALGKSVMVQVNIPGGATLIIVGKLKAFNNNSAFMVHPSLAAVIIRFTPEQVSSIENDNKDDIWIYLK
jgi:hypothetical protein